MKQKNTTQMLLDEIATLRLQLDAYKKLNAEIKENQNIEITLIEKGYPYNKEKPIHFVKLRYTYFMDNPEGIDEIKEKISQELAKGIMPFVAFEIKREGLTLSGVDSSSIEATITVKG